jgi:hypothetical protein
MIDTNLDSIILDRLQSLPIREWVNVFYEARGVLSRPEVDLLNINKNLNNMRTLRRGSVNVNDPNKSPTK